MALLIPLRLNTVLVLARSGNCDDGDIKRDRCYVGGVRHGDGDGVMGMGMPDAG